MVFSKGFFRPMFQVKFEICQYFKILGEHDLYSTEIFHRNFPQGMIIE